jgi:hypothetical protein
MKTKLLGAVAALALLATVSSSYAATVTQVMTTVDMGAGTVNFQVAYNGTPDFFTVDSLGRHADAFQFWIGDTRPLSFPPIVSIIRGGEIYLGGGIPIRDIVGHDSPPEITGGWGPVRGMVPFTLSNNLLDFTVTLAVLNVTGQFSYYFLGFGATTQQFYSYGSGIAVEGLAPVPLPAAFPLFATGLSVMGLVAWRRKRKVQTAS